VIIVETFVAGAAKTKGSMELRNRATGAMKESVIGSSQWRALMAAAVRDDIARRSREFLDSALVNVPAQLPYAGAVAVTLTFYLSPLRRDLFRWPVWERAGDLDKLVRNVLDALGSTSRNPRMNGGAIVDDNLVCRIVADKFNAEGFRAGVMIKVETL
jgi:Holliday junction resolvase RusA-like endonuclease